MFHSSKSSTAVIFREIKPADFKHLLWEKKLAGCLFCTTGENGRRHTLSTLIATFLSREEQILDE